MVLTSLLPVLPSRGLCMEWASAWSGPLAQSPFIATWVTRAACPLGRASISQLCYTEKQIHLLVCPISLLFGSHLVGSLQKCLAGGLCLGCVWGLGGVTLKSEVMCW
jgi:hypothetical protein